MAQSTSPTFKNLPWKMVFILAAIGLLWPASKAFGITDDLPSAVIGGVWFGIRILWIIIVLAVHDKRPFQTLLAASLLYELVAIIPQQINWDQEQFARVPGAIATLVVGAVTGMIIGAIATGIRSLTVKRS
jgi:hypothetical protein